jgi:hypothetical protein
MRCGMGETMVGFRVPLLNLYFQLPLSAILPLSTILPTYLPNWTPKADLTSIFNQHHPPWAELFM